MSGVLGKVGFKRYDLKGKPMIKIIGIDYEARTEVYLETERMLVMRVPGRKCWVGRGTWQYTNPEYVVWMKESETVLEHEKDFEYNRGNAAEVKMAMKALVSELESRALQ
jgi:hypothetical protein